MAAAMSAVAEPPQVGGLVAVAGLLGIYMVACADGRDGTVDLVAMGDADDVDGIAMARCTPAEAPTEEAKVVGSALALDRRRPADGECQDMGNSSVLEALMAASRGEGDKSRQLPGEILEYIEIPYVVGAATTDMIFEAHALEGKVGGVRPYEIPDEEDAEDYVSGGFDNGRPVARIQLNLRQLLSNTGGRVWDSSIVLAAWLAEGGREKLSLPALGGKVLELGAGLGVLGLAAAQLLRGSGCSVVMSDYDVDVLDRLLTNIKLNFASRPSEEQPTVAMIDFRDFERGRLSKDELAQRYSEHLGAYECVIAADIVYQQSHTTLSLVIDAMLRPERDAGPQPCAIMILPDSRPGLQTFADNARSEAYGGLHLSCAPIDSGCAMMRRLRQARRGLGANQSFSLYTLTRRRQ